MPDTPDTPTPPKRITLWTIIQSTCAAFFGVQTEANRQRDFESGNLWHFIIAGILFVLIFVLIIYTGVNWLIASTATTN